MAGDPTVKVMPKILPAASCAACCCGGMPPIIQEISGTGMAYLNAGGTMIKKDLAPGEEVSSRAGEWAGWRSAAMCVRGGGGTLHAPRGSEGLWGGRASTEG